MRWSLIVVLALGSACTKSGDANDMAAGLWCPPLDCNKYDCAATLSDFCAPDGGGVAGGPQVADCDGYRVVVFDYGDSGAEYYFDATSGALIAVVSEVANSGGERACVGGPATFTLPQHCQPLCG